MKTWTNAGTGDLKRFTAISMALANHPALISILFRPDRHELKSSPAAIKKQARAFSAGESILISVALDLWSESGEVPLIELLRLDPGNFTHVLKATAYRYGI